MRLKCKVKSVRNYIMNIGYMKYSELGYSWIGCVTSKDLPEVPEERFSHIIQPTNSNRCQQIKGSSYPRFNRSGNSHYLLPNKSWKFMAQDQRNICMGLY